MKKSRVILVLGLLLFGGCSGKGPENPPPPKGAAPVTRSPQTTPPQSLSLPGPGAPQEKTAAPGPVSPSGPPLAFYDPRGKVDPFVPAEVFPEWKGGPKMRGMPLEQFEISDYELVGIVAGSKIRKAMLQDISGKGYLVQVGTIIGKRGGKIVRIAEREVIIEEPFQDFFGKKIIRQISLKLPKAP